MERIAILNRCHRLRGLIYQRAHFSAGKKSIEVAVRPVLPFLLKEAFQQLWDYKSPAWAGKFLDDWFRQVMRSSGAVERPNN